MDKEILHFSLNFDFLHAHENENEKRSQSEEKENRFAVLTDEQRNQLLVDVEAKATKSSTNWVVKVFQGTQIDIVD